MPMKHEMSLKYVMSLIICYKIRYVIDNMHVMLHITRFIYIYIIYLNKSRNRGVSTIFSNIGVGLGQEQLVFFFNPDTIILLNF